MTAVESEGVAGISKTSCKHLRRSQMTQDFSTVACNGASCHQPFPSIASHVLPVASSPLSPPALTRTSSLLAQPVYLCLY